MRIFQAVSLFTESVCHRYQPVSDILKTRNRIYHRFHHPKNIIKSGIRRENSIPREIFGIILQPIPIVKLKKHRKKRILGCSSVLLYVVFI